MFSSKSTRIVWTVNGYLLLLAFVAVLVLLLAELRIDHWFHRSPDRGLVEVPAGDSLRARAAASQHLEYDRPTRIGDTPVFYSSVYVIDTRHTEAFLEAEQSMEEVGPDVVGERINVLFYDEQTRTARPLMESNAAILTVDAPSRERYGRDQEAMQQPFILYRIALRDTDGDKRINDQDASRFYLSDLSGRNLRPITPDGLDLSYHWFDDDSSSIWFEERTPIGENAPGTDHPLINRRVYRYDVAAATWDSFDALQQAFDTIRDAYGAR